MRIATWNVNSVKQRLEHAVTWLGETRPDVVCLQEIKCVDEAFPREAFEILGYNVAVHGQKGFNGVAVLSRLPFDEVSSGLPGDEGDVQSRFIEVVISTPEGVLRVCGIYLPNGNPVDTEKYPYKLSWMKRLKAHVANRLAYEEPLDRLRRLQRHPRAGGRRQPGGLGERCAVPAADPLGLPRADPSRHDRSAARDRPTRPGIYSFWDYQAGAWQKNNGIRIDHLLLLAAGRRPAQGGRHRQACAGLGEALRSRAGLGRPRLQKLNPPPLTPSS